MTLTVLALLVIAACAGLSLFLVFRKSHEVPPIVEQTKKEVIKLEEAKSLISDKITTNETRLADLEKRIKDSKDSADAIQRRVEGMTSAEVEAELKKRNL